MLHLLISIIGILLTIFFVVGVHEFGHFIVARCVGVKVLRFSIGFGKSLFRWHDKSGTEYVFAALPLGGYVKMLDESEGAVRTEDLHRAYNRQPIYKKIAIVVAGPLFNLIFAFLIYWAVFMIGFTSILPVVGKVTPNSIAAQAGIQPQQVITNIDDTSTHGWMKIIITLLNYAGETGKLQIATRKIDASTSTIHTLNLANWHMDKLKPDPLSSLGITPYEPNVPAVIGKFAVDSSVKSQLKVGDKIIAINNEPVADWNDVAIKIDKLPDANVSVKIIRHKKTFTINIKTHSERDLLFKKHGVIGIAPSFTWPAKLLIQNKYHPIAALSHAWEDTKDFTQLNMLVFGKLITGKVSTQSLGGPITIFESAGSALNQGLVPFLSFLAFLSISIGLVNILPIPGLDGGHILHQLIEFIIRRPIPQRIQILLYRLGMIALLLLIAQALINDILRL